MSQWFLIAGPGDIRDISFRRHSLHGSSEGVRAYRVFVGTEEWGFVYYGYSYTGWEAFSYNRPKASTPAEYLEEMRAQRLKRKAGDFRTDRSLDHVKGFGTRRAAAAYIVKTYGYWENN
jgi:hypothetical protein